MRIFLLMLLCCVANAADLVYSKVVIKGTPEVVLVGWWDAKNTMMWTNSVAKDADNGLSAPYSDERVISATKIHPPNKLPKAVQDRANKWERDWIAYHAKVAAQAAAAREAGKK